MSPTIAVIAPGAMGSALAARLTERGARVMTSLAGRSAATAARATAVGMVDASDEAIAAEADIILSVVPPAGALPLATRLCPAFARAKKDRLFVDLNAINPKTLHAVHAASGLPGEMFVDGAIIGLPPKPGERGPTLYVAGPAASRAEPLRELGLALEIMDGPLGAASALKMCYAGITKGFTAISSAMILAASRAGASDALAKELAASQPAMLARLHHAVPDMLPKAYRWVAEMEEIASFVGEDFPEHLVYRGAAGLYERLAAHPNDDASVLAAFAAMSRTEAD